MAFHCRVSRFTYIILGAFAGLLGIAFGGFIHLLIATKIKSFGVSYLDPYIPSKGKIFNGIFNSPTWKREKRSGFLDPKRENRQEKISMKWKYPNQ